MEIKEKIYIIAIILLAILLIVTNLDIQKAPERKPKTEEYIQNCEIWKICDYRKNL